MDERAAELAAMTTSAGAIEPLPEATQRRVVQWLAGTFGVELAGSSTPTLEVTPSGPKKRRTKATTTVGVGPAKTTKSKVGAPGYDKTLNLHPSDKIAFTDFVAEKTPRDRLQEHNVLAVYWLVQIADVEAATPDQVFTCYRGASWKLPPDLRNSLQKTAYEKGWLDTQDMDDIKITPQGLNFVERELPPKR